MGTVREVLRIPDVRRIELGWALTVVGEMAGTVALVVYGYGEGGGAPVAAEGGPARSSSMRTAKEARHSSRRTASPGRLGRSASGSSWPHSRTGYAATVCCAS